jgi:hypothetical protein
MDPSPSLDVRASHWRTGNHAWEVQQEEEKVKATFCEQKVAKKLFNAGPWAVWATTPMAQHK